jgi:hypothetical protein
MELTDHQLHLTQLLQQRAELDASISNNRELLWKVQGAIEYLTTIGVTLPAPEEPVEETTEVSVEE